MSFSELDVAIIGGGPAGAAAGSFLARSGHSVGLFEMGSFPRFHVGESLIPAANRTLDKLGVLSELDALGFPRKHGVQFFTPRGAARPFYFSEASDPDLHQTWQVLRSDFDSLLLDNAVTSGVKVFTDTEVLDVLMSGEVATGVRIKGPDGERTVSARVVIDASGTNSMLARRFAERMHIPGLENTSVYAHYENAQRDEGIDAGSTLIFRTGDGVWLWFIPLPETVSIGLVGSAKLVSARGGPPATILDAAIEGCEPLKARLASAERVGEVRVARDFSYRSGRDGGPGWLLVGDALGFIDPMYSSGLFLTLLSAELAADAIHAAFSAPTSNGASIDLSGWSGKWDEAYDRFLPLVRAFYRPDFYFGDLAKNPEHRTGLVDLLIGNVDTPLARAVVQEIHRLCGDRTPA